MCLVDLVEEGRKVRRVAVTHVLPEKERLVHELQSRFPPTWDSPQPVGRVLRSGTPEMLRSIDPDVVAAHTFDESHARLIRQIGIRSHVAVPLVARGRTHGVLSLGITESARQYDDDDVRFLAELAARAALALDNAFLYRELREVDRRKDEFLATLAHELRNPLAPMLNALELVRRARDGAVAERANAVLERQVRHMAKLVDDLLEVSRITRGKIDLKLEAVDLGRVALDVVEDHRSAAEARGLRIAAVVAPGKPHVVSGDRTRLNQVVSNLVANAIKFSDRGEITVSVDREEGEVRLSVRDQGVGMDEGTLKQLFQPFVQADRSLDRSRGGLGLGLALARALVELHKGRIVAKSGGPHAGAELTIALPESAATPERAATPTPTPEPKALDILVIDDNRDAAAMVAELLGTFGHRVSVAHDGEAGLRSALTSRFDVILCDLGLPIRDGFAIARELRSRGTASRLVAITGYGSEDARKKSLEAGFEGHLTKPVDVESLRRVLDG